MRDPAAPRLHANYDTYTSDDATGFAGAWGVYPFLPSGVTVVSDINTGLYILRVRLPDADNDGLADEAETNTGFFVSSEDAGTDPRCG